MTVKPEDPGDAKAVTTKDPDMTELYLVRRLYTKIESLDGEWRLQLAKDPDDPVGVMPVFDTREKAEKFGGGSEYVIPVEAEVQKDPDG